ncbi:hypothetical protein [Halobacterium litoreum]|uniref:C2H2-type domain-containing protein n=1 Tax=Halobacterium litoreum TaxID=2039234 RepID=A0ABD5N7Z9_9EURY|nr:hypothetical protein [Halobacterium litoreum]UHH14890.1 hypothetical protein LT972_14755 [Halobacterium litoreum]
MPGGSDVPDDRDDEDQCQHCGRWYGRDGVLSHESHCDWADSDVRMHDLEAKGARMRAADHSIDGVDLEAVDPDPAPAPDPDDVDAGDEQAATDGGPREPPTFGNDSTTTSSTSESAAATTSAPTLGDDRDCPECGSDSTVRPEDLDSDLLGPLPDGLEAKDRLCLACATYEDGGLCVEAFDEDARDDAVDVDGVVA